MITDMPQIIILLDKVDKTILYELDKNARQSNAAIGKKVRLSKEAVAYRIKKLEDSSLILRYSTIIDFFKLGLSKFKLYLRLRNASTEKMEEIGEYFNQHKKTEWVVISSGAWDIVAGFIVHNVNEFDEEVQKVLHRFSPYIHDKATTTTLHLSHATREYLGKETAAPKEYIYYKAVTDQVKVDELDIEILKLLANNGRMPVTKIAAHLKTTARIVQYRMRELENQGVILAYKVTLDPQRMGNIFCKGIFYLGNITHDRLNEFMNYCHNLNQALWPQRVLGKWDVELDVEVGSYDEFNNLLISIKEKFSDIIVNNEFLIVTKEFKLDFYPGCASAQD